VEVDKMTKAGLINLIAEKVALKKKDIAPVINVVFEAISEALANGEKCTFVDFGVFEVRHRAAREGRNPQNPKVIVKIPAKKVTVFRPRKGLKENVQEKKKKKGAGKKTRKP
jgi:DNA-binding protein HU-beta